MKKISKNSWKNPNKELEKETLDTIQEVSRALSEKYHFAYYDKDDIFQECFIFALESLKKYDGKSPLRNYLFICLKNRIFDLYRDKFCRPEHRDKPLNPKTMLAQPIDINSVDDEQESNMWVVHDEVEEIYQQEILNILDEELPIEDRMIYLKFLQGANLPQHKRKRIISKIREILSNHGYY